VSLFNFGDERQTVGTSVEKLGLPQGDYVYYEFWSGDWGETSGELARELPPHSNALVALHRKGPHPQLLSTDRHVTQGGVSLEAVAWDKASKTLAGTTRVVGGFPSRLYFRVPEGFSLAGVTSDGAQSSDRMTETGLLEIALKSEESGSVAWALRFE
jgi:hypothetical protein